MIKKYIIPVLCITAVLSGCGVSNKSIKRMQQMEEGVSSPTTIEEYKTAIQKYEKRQPQTYSDGYRHLFS